MGAHLNNLQALRGVACLGVVVLHLWCLEAEFGAQTPVFREIRWFGFAGVDIFFALSGFIITATNRRDLGRPRAVPGYLFRRFRRIYPTYWAVMGVSLAFMWVTLGGDYFGPEVRRNWPWWAALVPVDAANGVVGVAGTLCYEVMFYLAFGVLLLAPPRVAAAGLGGWGVVVVVALALPAPGSALGRHAVSPFVLEFLGGCAVAWLTARGFNRGWRAALVVGVAYAVVGTCVTVAVVTEPYPDAMVSQPLRVLVFGPPAVLIVYGLVAAEGRWPRRVPAWLLRTGDASYSLYLLHPTVLGAAKWVGVVVPHTRLPHLLWLAGTFAVVVASGLLFHRWVERPLMALGKRRPRPGAAPVPERLPGASAATTRRAA